MPGHEILVLLTAVLASGFASRVYASSQLAQRALDAPNARSAHYRPVPTGGGIVWLLVFTVGFAALSIFGVTWPLPLIAYTGIALLLAMVGWVDDRRGLSVRWRLLIYAIASLLLVAGFHEQWMARIPGMVALTVAAAVAVVAVLWLINLYNFMDGIDGIAAMQTVLFASSFALFCWIYLGDKALVSYALLLAAVNLGFLWANWSPATVFMGDAGSIPSGFLIAAITAYAGFAQPILLVTALILLALFVSDASVTLLLRALRGERLWQAHSGHAYQRLARQSASHAKVVCLAFCIFALWLLPLAWLCVLCPDLWLHALLAAYLPLAAGVVAAHRLT